jgi:hypothetical protein
VDGVSDKVKGAVIGALLLLLTLALIGDLYLFQAWQADKERAVKAEADLGTANGQTKICNDSIKGLQDESFKRGELANKAREVARQKAAELERQAQSELSTPATTPGNDCKSAQDRVDRILRQRAQRAQP